jgi:hypothetical protein
LICIPCAWLLWHIVTQHHNFFRQITLGENFCFLVHVRLCQDTSCFVKLVILQAVAMNDHNSLGLTSLSLLYRFVNVLYNCTIFLLLNTFWKEWSRLVTLSNVLLCIINLTRIPSLYSFWNNRTQRHMLLTSWV